MRKIGDDLEALGVICLSKEIYLMLRPNLQYCTLIGLEIFCLLKFACKDDFSFCATLQ